MFSNHVSLFTYPNFQPNGQALISCTDKPLMPEFKQNGVNVARFSPPRRLRTDEIRQVVDGFRLAARNPMEAGRIFFSLPLN